MNEQSLIASVPPRSSARSHVLDLLATRRKFFSLPQAFYTDPAIFKLDLEAIFYKRWIFAGVECEIPRPGDYFTLSIGPTPIVVLRDHEGAVRAFFNTCRHRGSKICLAEKGAVKRLTCPYHQWTYDLTGRLVAAGRMHEGFEREEYSLRPVNVRTSAGTVYICLATSAPDFDLYGPLIEPYLAPHDLTNARLVHETHAVVKGNWKLVMENSRECFHCPARHRELMQTFLHDYNFEEPGEDQQVHAFWAQCSTLGLHCENKEGDDFRIVRLPLRRGALSTTMDGKSAVSKLLGTMPTHDAGSVRWVHFPSTFNHAFADYAVLVRMLPLGPKETLFTMKWLVHRDAEAGRDYELENLTRVWSSTNDQDKVLVERNQEGVNSVGFAPGPYSQLAEQGVIRFVEWYCSTLGTHLDAQRRRSAVAA
ncbi:MAG: aromatic ring-hydroxylating dioxygenase subunit alpha [Betaproteobacteria bacterium]